MLLYPKSRILCVFRRVRWMLIRDVFHSSEGLYININDNLRAYVQTPKTLFGIGSIEDPKWITFETVIV